MMTKRPEELGVPKTDRAGAALRADPIERLRAALALADAGYSVQFWHQDIAVLLRAYDLQKGREHFLASPEAIDALRERLARALAKAHYEGRYGDVGYGPGHVQLNVDNNWQRFLERADELMLP